jgi:protein-disulfide isomerase
MNTTRTQGLPFRFYLLLAMIALAGGGALLYRVAEPRLAAARALRATLEPADLERMQGMALGRADAPVTLVEFADFQCGACAWFAENQMAAIKEHLVEPGLVRYVYLDYPLVNRHQHALLAARAGRCADEQGRFWDYHDKLYASLREWAPADDALPVFFDYAGMLGLDQGAFEACLRSERFTAEVQESRELGRSVGVRGTPTLFIDGKRLDGVPSFEEVERLVRAAIAGMEEQPVAR